MDLQSTVRKNSLKLVRLMGFEPMSPNLKGWCYTNLATGTYKIFNFFYLFFWRELCYLYSSNLFTKKPDIFICPVSFVLSKEYDFLNPSQMQDRTRHRFYIPISFIQFVFHLCIHFLFLPFLFKIKI